MKTKLILAALILAAGAQLPIFAQTSSSVNVGWYNGACQMGIPGMQNWYSTNQQFARIYDDFVVPAGGWTIAGVFSDNAVAAGVTQAYWEIRSGVSAANPGTLAASGLSPATATLITTWPDGETIYRIQVNGLSTPLPAGAYWLSVSPVTSVSQTYVCATLGSNSVGNPKGINPQAFYYSPPANMFFQPMQSTGGEGTSANYSLGVLISGNAPPAITSVMNSASWKSGAIAPGEIVAIEGTALGSYTPASLALDASGNVATTLGGVQVLIGGVAAPLLFAGATQINAVAPYETAGAANVSVQVVSAGQKSNAFPLTMAGAAPAIFTANGSGSGIAAALNADYSYNSQANPAAKGSYVTVYLTGEGQTAPSGITGKVTTVSSTGPLTPQPPGAVTATLGGEPAPILFYGEAPGIVSGVMQVSLQIPAAAASGSLPLSIAVGSQTTQSGVTIAVK